jgi:hypothetical protein
MGAFYGRDTSNGILPDPATLQPYQYARNNPVLYVDPSGNEFTLSGVLTSAVIGGLLDAALQYRADQTFGQIAWNFASGALEGALLYGAGSVLLKGTLKLLRYVRVARLSAEIAQVFSKIVPIGERFFPGSEIPEFFKLVTRLGDYVISSSTRTGSVAGALKHLVGEVLKKAGSAGATRLAEALAIQELSAAIEAAAAQGIKHGEKIIVRTAWAEWELIFDLSGPLPKLFHAVVKIL